MHLKDKALELLNSGFIDNEIYNCIINDIDIEPVAHRLGIQEVEASIRRYATTSTGRRSLLLIRWRANYPRILEMKW